MAQSEFNSLQEMYNAALAGQINVANFVQGFSNSMSAVTEQMRQENYTKYGEELPIDVVEEFSFDSEFDIAQNRVPLSIGYLSQIQDMYLILEGQVKNQNAQFWQSGDYVNKLVASQIDKKKIVLRMGTDFYENCVIKHLKANITSLYALKITVTLKYNFFEENYSRRMKDGRIMNPEPSIICDFPSESVWGGIKTS